MLGEQYPNDKLFEEIAGYLPPMDPSLAKIDRYLEDERLYRLIQKDLSQRWPKTLQTGRSSTPVEVVLRMLVIKRLYGYSYEETERNVSDSLVLRKFCRVYLHAVPDDTTLIRWANVIHAKTLEKFNQRITQLAMEHKVTKGRKLRTDGTVVETNIHAPSDSRQLADSVRVLARTLLGARKVLKAAGQRLPPGFRNFTRIARQRARQIGSMLSARKESVRAIGKQKYQELLEMTRKTVKWATQMLAQLQHHQRQGSERLAQSLATFIPRSQQVIDQTIRRVFKKEQVSAREKLVSIFEPHTDIIRRGKELQPVEYGHKIWLNEVDGGIISH